MKVMTRLYFGQHLVSNLIMNSCFIMILWHLNDAKNYLTL